MNFKLDIDQLLGKSVKEVNKKISVVEKRKFKDLAFTDLLIDENDEPMRHGIYIIHDENQECVYVGRCYSPHFVDRLGTHLGMSPNYKDTFLTKLVKSKGYTQDFSGYAKAAKLLPEYTYMIVNANRKGKEFISKLEKVFMVLLQPSLNSLPKKVKSIRLSDDDLFDLNIYN